MPKFYPCSIACWEVLLCLAERCDIAYYNCKHLVHQVVGGCPYAIKRMGLFPGDALIFGTEECFLENGIQLTYICQVSCLYGEILEETAASTEDFSINKVSILHVYDWIMHKKKKECMSRELYMEVVSADFQGRLLLIKGIWGGSLHLLGSVNKITSVKQDITCNMVCLQLQQLGLFAIHFKDRISFYSCHYTTAENNGSVNSVEGSSRNYAIQRCGRKNDTEVRSHLCLATAE